MLSVSVSATPTVSRTCGRRARNAGCCGRLLQAALDAAQSCGRAMQAWPEGGVLTRLALVPRHEQAGTQPCSARTPPFPPPTPSPRAHTHTPQAHLVVPAGNDVDRLVRAPGCRHKRLAGLGGGAPAANRGASSLGRATPQLQRFLAHGQRRRQAYPHASPARCGSRAQTWGRGAGHGGTQGSALMARLMLGCMACRPGAGSVSSLCSLLCSSRAHGTPRPAAVKARGPWLTCRSLRDACRWAAQSRASGCAASAWPSAPRCPSASEGCQLQRCQGGRAPGMQPRGSPQLRHPWQAWPGCPQERDKPAGRRTAQSAWSGHVPIRTTALRVLLWLCRPIRRHVSKGGVGGGSQRGSTCIQRVGAVQLHELGVCRGRARRAGRGRAGLDGG